MIIDSIYFNPNLGFAENMVLGIYEDFHIGFYYNLSKFEYIISNNKIEISDKMLNDISIDLINNHYEKFDNINYLYKLWIFDLGNNFHIYTSFRFYDAADVKYSIDECIIKGII